MKRRLKDWLQYLEHAWLNPAIHNVGNPKPPWPLSAGLGIHIRRISPGWYVPSSSSRRSLGKSDRHASTTSSTLGPATPAAPLFCATLSSAHAIFATNAAPSSKRRLSCTWVIDLGGRICRLSCRSLSAATRLWPRIRPTPQPVRPLSGCRQTRTTVGTIRPFSTCHPLRSTGVIRLHRDYGVIRLLHGLCQHVDSFVSPAAAHVRPTRGDLLG